MLGAFLACSVCAMKPSWLVTNLSQPSWWIFNLLVDYTGTMYLQLCAGV